MNKKFEEIINHLEQQYSRVFELFEFDKDIIEIVVKDLEEVSNRLASQGIENQHMLPNNAIRLLKKLHEKGPTRTKYKPVYNQAIVLLVSYFGSAVSSLFNEGLTCYLNNIDKLPKGLLREEFKFSLSELQKLEYDLSSEIGRIIARKSDISFQDMQSIRKAFKKFFDVDIEKDRNVDNIIAAQSLRHAIVHNSEIIDDKCKRQIEIAENRQVVFKPKTGSLIEIDSQDLQKIVVSMRFYILNLTNRLNDKLST